MCVCERERQRERQRERDRDRQTETETERQRVGLLLLQLFPNSGATDIVIVNLFCIAVGTAIAWCGGRCAMPDGHCLN